MRTIRALKHDWGRPMPKLPAFSLRDSDARQRSFPSGRPTLLAFVNEDCPTSGLSMPLLQQAQRAFGDGVDIWAVGQDSSGNAALVERHRLTLPMLDDSELRVSYAYDIDTVPTVILADGDGVELSRAVGFGRDDWRELFAALGRLSGAPLPTVDWDEYPELRPGCGSRSVEPAIAERLAAEAEGSPLRARRIEIGEADDVDEFMLDQGFTDGLPVVAPSPERVLRMLTGTARDAQEVVVEVPPNLAPATVEKVAINAVLAGCKPEYLPVVIAALEASLAPEFNVHGVMATTMGASPAVVVNGPIRERIGMNMGLGALGQGNRANATIGRALRLVLRNVGGARPGGTERSTLGGPAKFTLSFAEWEQRSPWESLHVERGFDADESVVTVFAVTGGPQVIVDQTSRSARQLAGSIGLAVGAVFHPKSPTSDVLLVISPEHADTLARDGWTKADLREHIIAVTSMPLRDRLPTADIGGVGEPDAPAPSAEELERIVPKFRSPEAIHIVVAGGDAGKFSAIFSGWQSTPASKQIEEVR